MASQLFPVAALLLGSAFLVMAGGLHGLLLPVRGVIEDFTTGELGLIGTGWAIGFVAGCLLVPAIVRRAGHVRAFGVMASIAAVVILLNLLIITPWAWILTRGISGFCFAGAAMVVESWLNERATRENRGTIFSVYQMVNFAASTGGQLLMVIRPPTDYFYFAIGAILYCLAILPTALSTAERPRPLTTSRLDLRRLYSNSPVAAIACFLIGMANGAFGTLGPVYAQRIGLPVPSVALLMAGSLLGGSLVQYPLGRLSDRMDRRKVLVGIAAGAIVVGLLIFLTAPRAPGLVVGLLIIYGAMIYPMYALSVAHANDFAAADEFVRIAGGLLLLLGIGTILGPILAALAMDAVAPEGLFAFMVLVHLSIALYAAFRMSQRRAPPYLARESFQGLSVAKAATPESALLDPRAATPEEGGDRDPE
jgi:MFS family permease